MGLPVVIPIDWAIPLRFTALPGLWGLRLLAERGPWGRGQIGELSKFCLSLSGSFGPRRNSPVLPLLPLVVIESACPRLRWVPMDDPRPPREGAIDPLRSIDPRCREWGGPRLAGAQCFRVLGQTRSLAPPKT